MTAFSTEDARGLAWYVLTDAAFRARFNNDAPQQIEEPPPYQGDAVALKNNQRLWELFELQERSAALIRILIINIFPVHILQAVEVNSSVAHLETIDLLVQLRAAFPLTEADIAVMLASLSSHYVHTDNIRAFINGQRNTLAQLADAGHPLPPLLAISEMSKAFTSSAVDKQDFAPMFSEFRVAHGALAAQTVAHFTSFVIVFVEQRLPHYRKANLATRHALEAQLVPAVPAPVAAAAIVQPQQQRRRGGRGGRGGQGGRAAAAAPAAAAAIPPGRPRFYCWTCGVPADVTRQHFSLNCNSPAAGHQWEATYLVQMGGKRA